MTPSQHAKVLEALKQSDAGFALASMLRGDVPIGEFQAALIGCIDEALSIMRSEGVGEPEATKSMARRLLWIAYSWNDHNFEAAHIEARKEAAKHGITNFDEANAWLAAPPAEQTEVKP